MKKKKNQSFGAAKTKTHRRRRRTDTDTIVICKYPKQIWRQRRNSKSRRLHRLLHPPVPSSNCLRRMRTASAVFFSTPADPLLLRRRLKTLSLKSRRPRGSAQFTRSSPAMVLKMIKLNLLSPLSWFAIY